MKVQSIIWTPEGSENYLGAVRLRKEASTLSRDAYKLALSVQIDMMVRAAMENGQDTRAMVEQPMWDNDRLTPPRNLMELGLLMAMDSETLHNRSCSSDQEWPAKGPFKNDLEAESVISERTLEEFLNRLYP